MLQLIDDAMKFAAKAHDKVYRKSENIPYIYHPTMLGFYLMRHGYSDEVIAAALLHDTVEDTDTTIEELELNFGSKVANLVAACTENKEHSWEERKQHQIDAIRTTSLEVVAIKCADKLNNISDIVIDYQNKGDKIWNKFSRGYEKQKWYYRGLLDSFKSRDDFKEHILLKALETQIIKIFPS